MKRQNDISAAADDGFHEIQLSGKQLVFLFMATTIVSVVIFLFGVLVGRGVRAETGGPQANVDAPITAEAGPGVDAPPPGAAAPGTAPPADQLSYYERLGGGAAQAPETLKNTPDPAPVPEPVVEKPRAEAKTPPPPRPAPAPVQTPAPAAKAPATAPATGLETASGLTIQVAVLERSKADALVKRLSEKGYPAYMASAAAGNQNIVRVRVGRYQERRQAEQVAARLKKEEQFEPWITR